MCECMCVCTCPQATQRHVPYSVCIVLKFACDLCTLASRHTCATRTCIYTHCMYIHTHIQHQPEVPYMQSINIQLYIPAKGTIFQEMLRDLLAMVCHVICPMVHNLLQTLYGLLNLFRSARLSQLKHESMLTP